MRQEDIPLPYLKLTDSQDFLGCKLYASHQATRSENGKILVKKIQDQINHWKSGKFLSFTSRPWSINSYCLSKIWYRSAVIDLKISDVEKITSAIKSWLYQDMLITVYCLLFYIARTLALFAWR